MTSVRRGGSTRRLVAWLMASVFCAGAAVQAAPPGSDATTTQPQTNRAKQETVTGTTQAQTKAMSGSGYHGPKPAGEAKELSNEAKQQVMSGVAKSAKDQYRPMAPPPAAADRSARNAAKPKMSDPEMQEQIRKHQRS